MEGRQSRLSDCSRDEAYDGSRQHNAYAPSWLTLRSTSAQRVASCGLQVRMMTQKWNVRSAWVSFNRGVASRVVTPSAKNAGKSTCWHRWVGGAGSFGTCN